MDMYKRLDELKSQLVELFEDEPTLENALAVEQRAKQYVFAVNHIVAGTSPSIDTVALAYKGGEGTSSGFGAGEIADDDANVVFVSEHDDGSGQDTNP